MVLKKKILKTEKKDNSKDNSIVNKAKNTIGQSKNSRIRKKINSPKVKGYIYIIIVLGLLLFDRITKIWAMNQKSILDYGWFAINYVVNTGAGFSILENNNTLLIFISLIALGLFIYFYDHFSKAGLLLVISGLIGNLIDRIVLGHVIDFFDLKFWPIFNVADSLIFIGTILIIIKFIRE